MDDDDDFGDFGGFEAADPAEVQETGTVTATPSQWAMYTAAAVQSTTDTPATTPARSAADEKDDTASVPTFDGAMTPPVRETEKSEATKEMKSEAMKETSQTPVHQGAGDTALKAEQKIQWPTVQEHKQNLQDQTSAKTEASPSPQREVPVVSPAENDKEAQSTLKAVQAHRDNLLKESERMSANQVRWNKELEECKEQLVHQVERYDQLQVIHRNAITEMRNAGHEALSVIVAEYKELSKTTLAQQKESAHTELLTVMDEHAARWQNCLKEQEDHTKSALAEQHAKMSEQLDVALKTQREQLQEELQTALKEEREKHSVALHDALETEREASRLALETALHEERKKSQGAAQEERTKLQSLVVDEREKSVQAIKNALDAEREKCQECIRIALEDERTNAARQMKQMMEEAKREMVAYAETQKQADAAVRLRSLSTMDLFLEGTRKQLELLMTGSQPTPKTLEQKTEINPSS